MIFRIFLPESSLNYLLVSRHSLKSETTGPWIHVWVLACPKKKGSTIMSSRQGQGLKTCRERLYGDRVGMIARYDIESMQSSSYEQNREEPAI